MSDELGFLRRWARRKTEARAKAEPPKTDGAAGRPEPESEAPPGQAARAQAAVTSPAANDAPALPDLESLTTESDFSVFMGPQVSDDLRTAALRRLWQLDPTLSAPDGLLDYADDFTDAGTVTEALKTAYQVGSGYLGAATAEPDESPPGRTTGCAVETADTAPPAAHLTGEGGAETAEAKSDLAAAKVPQDGKTGTRLQ